MLHWLTEYIEIHSIDWEDQELLRTLEKVEEDEIWKKLNDEEKRAEYKAQEKKKTTELSKDPEEIKRLRLEKVLKKKENWKPRTKPEHYSIDEDDHEET